MSQKRIHSGFRLFLILSIVLLIIDQLTKWWARAAVEGVEGRSISPLWAGVFELKLVYNEGVAFGLFQGIGVMLAPLALVMAIGAGYFSWKGSREPRYFHVMLGLLTAGAIGNMIDRVVAGRVTDMFWIRAINFPVFNIADICITFAGALLIFNAIRGGSSEDEAPTKPGENLEAEQPTESEGEARVADHHPTEHPGSR